MNAIEKVAEKIRKTLPTAEVRLDAPANRTGRWFLDVSHEGADAIVEWKPRRGFGVSTYSAASLGERPDEVYETERDALRRVLELLRTGERTRSPRDVLLQELREKHHISQEQLAKLLKVSQASVSKLERRGDMHISTLRRLIQALGGELELRARFRDEVVRIQKLGDVDFDDAKRGARR